MKTPRRSRHFPLCPTLFLLVSALFAFCPLTADSAAAARSAKPAPPPAADRTAAEAAPPVPAAPDGRPIPVMRAEPPPAQSDAAAAESAGTAPSAPADPAPDAPAGKTPAEKLAMLDDLVKQDKYLSEEIAESRRALERAPKNTDTAALIARIDTLNQRLGETRRDFTRIAAGMDPAALQGTAKHEEKFDWKAEMTGLVEPLIKEMRDFTATAKKKADLRETIDALGERLDHVDQAIAHARDLIGESRDKALTARLKDLLETWRNEQSRLNGKRELAEMDLHQLQAQDGTIWSRGLAQARDFFRTRGLILLGALSAFVGVFLVIRGLFGLLLRRLPEAAGPGARGRRLYSRLIGVFAQVFSVAAALAAMLAVFFVAADWLMISVVLLLCFAGIWTLRQNLPKQWKRSLFLLNMGPVREGERLVLNGVPWRVDSLGIFCALSNPTLDQKLRLPIEQLLNQTSRPYNLDEPWFPCKKGDFLMLGGDVVQVTRLSSEQVAVNNLGTGMTQVYGTAAFLGMAVGNMSRKFLVRVPLSLSYDLQADITGTVPQTLKAWIQERLEEEGYSAKCNGLTCEFGGAGESALDMTVALEFQGEMAGLYYRLRRALWRWCVDCCTAKGWEIPFTQIVVHGPDKPGTAAAPSAPSAPGPIVKDAATP